MLYIKRNEIIIPRGQILITLRNVKTGRVIQELVENLVTTVGKESIANIIRGNTARGIITYCALGTSAVAPALGDTDLGAELVRKLISVRSTTNNIASFETFFTTSEGNGTLREAGLFGDDATATADSGTLFCHAAINRVKTSNDTLSLVWTIAIG